ncbi:hypothetical protein C8R43DRAFT_1104027 [Mycena crocata]|nr:hypothetical protein C8R43DRAFT_1104022 [Mycena crocata]KAJ7166426.1 hypothetical protein C8R43DRAFT_1104025 [Mycena crocata]KAJ7166430.1 hypothetical protein C8R43DRAFT_1104027 [Mycena crocata]
MSSTPAARSAAFKISIRFSVFPRTRQLVAVFHVLAFRRTDLRVQVLVVLENPAQNFNLSTFNYVFPHAPSSISNKAMAQPSQQRVDNLISSPNYSKVQFYASHPFPLLKTQISSLLQFDVYVQFYAPYSFPAEVLQFRRVQLPLNMTRNSSVAPVLNLTQMLFKTL